MSQELSTEIISAEIVFSNRDISRQSDITDEFREQLDTLDIQLEKFANHADRYDYTVAVACGILCGVLDSQIAQRTNNILNSTKFNLSGKDISNSESLKKQLIAKAREQGIEYARKHKGETSIAGLTGAVLAGCLKKNVNGKYIVINKETGEEEFDTGKVIELFGPLIITGMIRWLTAERNEAEIDESDLPKALKNLLHILRKNPKVRKILSEFDLKKFKLEDLEKLGVPCFFLSLVKPKLEERNITPKTAYKKLSNTATKLTQKLPSFSLKNLKTLGNQAISVIANEFLVRGFYFARHFVDEFNHCDDIENIDWNKVLPFDNRTVVRMMSIASLTFTAADMTDAAIRTAIEVQAGNPMEVMNYFTRVNVVGVGHAAIAVYKDVSMEWKEADLIHERRMLAEKFSIKQVDALIAYRQQMETIVETYLAEDLEAFLTGSGDIEQGLILNDSNMVIAGNVKIQRILGRKPQFTTQTEFDSLMDSGEDFVL